MLTFLCYLDCPTVGFSLSSLRKAVFPYNIFLSLSPVKEMGSLLVTVSAFVDVPNFATADSAVARSTSPQVSGSLKFVHLDSLRQDLPLAIETQHIKKGIQNKHKEG